MLEYATLHFDGSYRSTVEVGSNGFQHISCTFVLPQTRSPTLLARAHSMPDTTCKVITIYIHTPIVGVLLHSLMIKIKIKIKIILLVKIN